MVIKLRAPLSEELAHFSAGDCMTTKNASREALLLEAELNLPLDARKAVPVASRAVKRESF